MLLPKLITSIVRITFSRLVRKQKSNLLYATHIFTNPVVAGIVRYPEEYLYSSAGHYARLKENLLM